MGICWHFSGSCSEMLPTLLDKLCVSVSVGCLLAAILADWRAVSMQGVWPMVGAWLRICHPPTIWIPVRRSFSSSSRPVRVRFAPSPTGTVNMTILNNHMWAQCFRSVSKNFGVIDPHPRVYADFSSESGSALRQRSDVIWTFGPQSIFLNRYRHRTVGR